MIFNVLKTTVALASVGSVLAFPLESRNASLVPERITQYSDLTCPLNLTQAPKPQYELVQRGPSSSISESDMVTFLSEPVSRQLITWIAEKTVSIMPASKELRKEQSKSKLVRSLSAFIEDMVLQSSTTRGTLMSTSIILDQVAPKTQHMKATSYNMYEKSFLAALILAWKDNHDVSWFNKHWAEFVGERYSRDAIDESEQMLFKALSFKVKITNAELDRNVQEFLCQVLGGRKGRGRQG